MASGVYYCFSGCTYEEFVSVTLVERWPDLGPKRGARADTFPTQPNRYARGRVQSGLVRNLGRKGLSRKEKERDDCDNEQVKKTEMGISGLRGTSYIPKDD